MREHIAEWGQHEAQSWSNGSFLEGDRRGAFCDALDTRVQILGEAAEAGLVYWARKQKKSAA
jgi:hypothetical protein